MKKQISRDEYVLAVLQDDLKHRHSKRLKDEEKLILSPNLDSVEENEKRFQLLSRVNGAFSGNILNSFGKFYKTVISKEEFLQLNWCPKGRPESDAIDRMTANSRKFSDILQFIKDKEHCKIEDIEIKKEISDMERYGKLLEKESAINKRVYSIKSNSNYYVLDGNHRAGGMIYNIHKLGKYTLFEHFGAEN